MADEFDMAQEREMKDRDLCIANARVQVKKLESGFCHNCGEKVQGEFCDADCRTDWEKRKRFSLGAS